MKNPDYIILMLASTFLLLFIDSNLTLFQFWLIEIIGVVMWTWCCRKVGCCFSCCRQTDDQTERLVVGNVSVTSSTPRSIDYYTVHRIESSKSYDLRNNIGDVELNKCDRNISSGKTKPCFTEKKNSEINLETYGTSPAVNWTPKIYKVQPDLGYEGGTSCTSSNRTRHQSQRRHKSLRKLPLEMDHDVGNFRVKSDGHQPSGGEDNADFFPITVSAPDLIKDKQVGKFPTRPSLANTLTIGGSISVQNQQARWMKSQSMSDVNASDSSDKVAREHGINKALYLNNHAAHTNVFEAKGNEYQAKPQILPCIEWDEELSYGIINFKASYYQQTKRLFITVMNVEDLPPKGRCYLYDVILRISVLPPEKQTKHSQIVSDNLNPQFNEDFSFVLKDITDKVLRISVFDAECQGKYNVIAHTLLHLDSTINIVSRSFCLKLYRQSKADLCPGFLQISLNYSTSTERMLVKIHQGQSLNILPQVVHNVTPPQREKYNTYAKVTLFTGEVKVKSKKTGVVQNSRDPFYDGTFEFDLTSDDYESFLVVSVMLKSLLKESPIGRVILGPFQLASKGKLTPWGRAMSKNEVVTLWYRMCI